MTLRAALVLRRSMAARRPRLRYVVRRSATRTLNVTPFYVAVRRYTKLVVRAPDAEEPATVRELEQLELS